MEVCIITPLTDWNNLENAMVKINVRYRYLHLSDSDVKVTRQHKDIKIPQQTEQRLSLPLAVLCCDQTPTVAPTLHPSQTELSLSLSLVVGRSRTGSSTETLFWISLS